MNTIIENRVMTFGKYKGQEIKRLILSNIGYIMWCLSNLSWFKLNNEEQAVYDALAIANVKYGVKFPFSEEEMCSHIKDKDSLEKLQSPFIIGADGSILFSDKEKDNPVIKSVIKYIRGSKPDLYDHLHAMSTILSKMPIEMFGEENDVAMGDIIY